MAYPQQPIAMRAYQLMQVATPPGKANAPARPGLFIWNHQSPRPSRRYDYADTTLLYMLYIVLCDFCSCSLCDRIKATANCWSHILSGLENTRTLGDILPLALCFSFLLAGEAGWLAKFADSLATTPAIFSAITGRQREYHF